MNIRCVVCDPIDPLVLCACNEPSTRRDFKSVNYVCFFIVLSVFIASWSWVVSRVEAASTDAYVTLSLPTVSPDQQMPPDTVTAAPEVPVVAAEVPADPVPTRLLDTVRHAPLAKGYAYVPVGCLELRRLALSAGLPEWMSLVAWRESRCQSGAVRDDVATGDLSFGYFQINTMGYLWGEIKKRCQVAQREELLEPVTNVRCAGALYRAYGYKPWDSGSYFK